MRQVDNFSISLNNQIDCTVVTNIMKADGIGRQGLGLMGCLKDEVKFNVVKMQPYLTQGVDSDTLKILQRPALPLGNVLFWTYILGLNSDICQLHQHLNCYLKIAYSMFESSAIPSLWVSILNSYFDCVVVPDEWLVKVYQDSGVNIPIFILPLGIWLEDFLAQPLKSKRNDVFTFGMSAGFWERKNHVKLLRAFQKSRYANDSKFKLKLHGRFGPYKSEVEKAFKEVNLNNAELICGPLNDLDYLNFMKSIDCYIYPSKGEGFSITPRESMAFGIPTTITNNTVHKTIINSCLVNSIPANLKIPAIYEVFNNEKIGNFYDCDIDWIITQMEEIEGHYDYYLANAQESRNWTKQYLWSNLKLQYLQLLKPKQVISSSRNYIGWNQIETNDSKLLKKLSKLKDFYK